MNPYSQLADIIIRLEMALRDSELWESQPPPEEALASQQPFCIDTLSFNQWLQFIFISRIKLIIENQEPLPASSEIVPIAEEYFSNSDLHSRAIIEVLREFDHLIGGQS